MPELDEMFTAFFGEHWKCKSCGATAIPIYEYGTLGASMFNGVRCLGCGEVWERNNWVKDKSR